MASECPKSNSTKTHNTIRILFVDLISETVDLRLELSSEITARYDCRIACNSFGSCSTDCLHHVVWRSEVNHVREIAIRSDRKSTRLNSSHLGISYAVFCLKKKNQ